MSASAAQFFSASLFGKSLIVLLGAVGAMVVAAAGMLLARGRAPRSVSRGHAAAAANPLDRMRDGVARRSHPVVAASLALVCGLALALAVTCVIGAAAKTGVVVHLDRPLARFVDRHRVGAVTRVMLTATMLGSYTVVYTIAAVGGLMVGVLSRRWLPLFVLLASVPAEIVIQKFVADLIHGTKPAQAVAVGPPGGFFSGGSARTLIVCGLLAYFAGWAGLERRQRALLWTCAALATFIEGFSRLYLGRHWPVDIVGGWVLGALVLAAAVFAAGALRPAADFDHAARPRHSHRTQPPGGYGALAPHDGSVSRSREG